MKKFVAHPNSDLPLIRWHILRDIHTGEPSGGLRAVYDDERYELSFHDGNWIALIVVELSNPSGFRELDEWTFREVAKDPDIIKVMAKVQVYAAKLEERKAAEEYEED